MIRFIREFGNAGGHLTEWLIRAGYNSLQPQRLFHLKPVLVFCLLIGLAIPARACTEDTVLDLVGELEAPGGYDTVYYGVRVTPPRPITTMTVGEVLDWQREAVRGGSVSTAAGRYQIIRPTLQGLVDQGVVSPGTRFDTATQDRLGRHLLHETGYRAGNASPVAADRIARVWASLPRTSGTDPGRSYYEGIAGNHALINASSWLGVLDCSLSVAQAVRDTGVIRAGQRFGFAWDRFLKDLSLRSKQVLDVTAAAGVALLLGLFLIDLVLRGGRQAITGQEPGGIIGDLALRFATLGLCYAVLQWPGETIDLVAGQARQAAGGSAESGTAFALADYVAGKMTLILSLHEGFMALPLGAQLALAVFSFAILAAVALQISFILYWYVNLFLAGVGGLLLLGFGGLTQTVPVARAWLLHMLGAALSLLAVWFVLAFVQDLAWEARTVINPLGAALTVTLMELLSLALLLVLPASVGSLAKG